MKKPSINIRFNRNGKTINFSTGASVQLDGYTDVKAYEKEGVAAVRGVMREGYHISSEAGRPRKVLSNARLVTYLCGKFRCEPGDCLPAWTGAEEGVLFFGGMQPEEGTRYVLDERYTPIEVEYNRREGDWAYVHDNWTEFTREVRANLPPRMSAYRCGRVVLLTGDPAGSLELTPKRQSGNLMLVSHPLANHLRGLYGGTEEGMRLRAALVPGGVALADSLETLASANLTRPELLNLDGSRYCFINLSGEEKGSIYLSVPAVALLGGVEQLDIYGCRGCLALKAERRGALRLNKCGYAHYVHSRRLCELLREQQPMAKRFYLLKYGDLWLLWPGTVRPAGLPPSADFSKLDLTSPKTKRERAGVQRVAAAVEEKRVYGR